MRLIRKAIAGHRVGMAMAVPHIYEELELVWLLSLHSMAVPLPNCLLQSCIRSYYQVDDILDCCGATRFTTGQ